MKIAYLECPTGIAGDMCLGATVDAGVPLKYLIEQLRGLKIEDEYNLEAEKVDRNGQRATKVNVNLLNTPKHHRHLPEIERIIQTAELPAKALIWSLKVFRQLAIAEGQVHGIAPEKVHFHEVGATDAIVDIVGTCLALDWLGIEELFCSAMPTGGGTIKAAHGILPVPVPAVLKLWESRQVPVYSNGIDRELVTPTGAAIATTLATSFGKPPTMKLDRVGLGAGTINLPLPNILRLWLGTVETESPKNTKTILETITVLETQIDDLSPVAIAYTCEELFRVGALDVFTISIGMKKSRSGILLTVICPPDKVNDCEAIIFKETTTLGIRRFSQERSILKREIQPVKTDYGTIRVKIATIGDNIVNVQPEYEDCATIARKSDLPWQEVRKMALNNWYDLKK
ncbi:MAG: nickel pincer cofactor biosynthesis protein LarC [Prochloraceae cyanobacterium]